MSARLLRCKSLTPLLRSSGRLCTASGPRVVVRSPTFLSRRTSALYSSSPAGRGVAMVGQFVKRQAYFVLLVGGVSAGALLLVSAAMRRNVTCDCLWCCR